MPDTDWQLTFDMVAKYIKELEDALALYGIDVHTEGWHDKLPKPPVPTTPPPVPTTPPPVPTTPPPTTPPPTTPPPTTPPPTTPPPQPTGKTLLGISGSKEIAGAVQRSFSSGGISGPIKRASKAVCPRIHHSWKVLGSGIPNDTALKAALANFLPGDEVEVEHETDVKFRKDGNTADLAARLKAKNDFYAAVKRLRPDLLVVNTFSSFTFAPAQFSTATKYDAKADVLGADLDGGNFPHNYGDPVRLNNIVAHAKKYYGGKWTCPEFAWKDDPQGGRMPTIKSQIAAIAKFGPMEISYHNNPSFGATFTDAELAEYAALVHQYNG